MENTVRAFSSLGARESGPEAEPEQEKLGETLETLGRKERLGDFLASRAEADDTDPVETVRDVREEI